MVVTNALDLLCINKCTSIYNHSTHETFSLGLKEALEERKTLIDERLTCCIEKKIPPVQDAVHEVKAMAAKLRARAEAVKSEICATAEECVKRIVSRKQEMLARVNGLITFLFFPVRRDKVTLHMITSGRHFHILYY